MGSSRNTRPIAPIEEGDSLIVEIEIERASTWGFGS